MIQGSALVPSSWAELLVQVFLGVLGAALLVLALRGRRVLGAPRCSACGHDLRTFAGPPTVCPECGASLSAAGAVDFARRRRGALAAVAAALLLITAMLAPWGRHTVSRLLEGRVDRATAPRTIQPPTLAQLLENWREHRGAVDWRALAMAARESIPTPDQAEDILEILSGSRGDRSEGRSTTEWEHLDELCGLLDLVLPAEHRARVAGLWAAPLVIEMPTRVAVGEPWAVVLHSVPRRERGRIVATPEGLPIGAIPYHAVLRLVAMRATPLTGAAPGEPLAQRSTEGAVGVSIHRPMAPSLDAGSIEVEMEVVRSFFRMDDLPRSGLPEDSSRWPPPVLEENLVIRQRVQIVRPGEALVERLVDPRRAEEVDLALSVRTCRVESSGRGRRIAVTARIVPPGGVRIAGRWRIRLGDRWLDGPLVAAWGSPTNFAVQGPLEWSVPLSETEFPAVPDHVDVVIDPVDNEVGLVPRDGAPIWGRRIEQRGVAVEGSSTAAGDSPRGVDS